jgi:pimeloyl-ACP methyl ester carboxylesterase
VVIIEAGAQDWSTGWQRPQSAIAQHTRVCTYDRAGFGWSDASDDPKDGLHMVGDLHQLLATANVPRPVVLVGHSLGGMLNRIYYQEYPEEVAGIVLLEPGAPDQIDEMFPEAGGGPAFGGWVDVAASIAARVGIVRWMYRDLFEGKGYPDNEVAATRARMALPAAARALASTVRHLPVTTAQTRVNVSLGDLPVAVVYTSKFDEIGTHFESEAERQDFRAAYIAYWEYVSGLSQRGSAPIVIEGANHLSLIRDDRYWPLAVEVILEQVKEVRESP